MSPTPSQSLNFTFLLIRVIVVVVRRSTVLVERSDVPVPLFYVNDLDFFSLRVHPELNYLTSVTTGRRVVSFPSPILCEVEEEKTGGRRRPTEGNRLGRTFSVEILQVHCVRYLRFQDLSCLYSLLPTSYRLVFVSCRWHSYAMVLSVFFYVRRGTKIGHR